MIGPKLMSAALLFVTAGSLTNAASAITIELAKKCETLTVVAFPPLPSKIGKWDRKGRSGKDAQAYFDKCVEKDGKLNDRSSNEAK